MSWTFAKQDCTPIDAWRTWLRSHTLNWIICILHPFSIFNTFFSINLFYSFFSLFSACLFYVAILFTWNFLQKVTYTTEVLWHFALLRPSSIESKKRKKEINKKMKEWLTGFELIMKSFVFWTLDTWNLEW